ncbi:MAG: response regulator [Candidatus Omnitrophica bacterium]|nr:response regulator [Candidatus Omnitrophota bacterium]
MTTPEHKDTAARRSAHRAISSRGLQALLRQIDELTSRLEEAEDALNAIREGEVDAIVVKGSKGDQVFSLHGAESIYRLIVETMKEAACTVTLDGKVLFSNNQVSELLQIPLNQLIGRSLTDFVVPDDREPLARFLHSSQSHSIKQRIVFQGTAGPVPAHVSSNVLRQSDGVSICIVAADLTELEASTGMLQDLRRQQDLLKRSNQRLALLSDIAGRLLQTRKPLDEINSICLKVMSLLDCQTFCNCLKKPGRPDLSVNSYAGMPDNAAEWVAWLNQGRPTCCGENCDLEPIVVEAGRRKIGPTWSSLLHALRIQAFACMPLVAHGECVGRLCFGSRMRDCFAPEDLVFMRTVASQVAIAVHRANTEEALAHSEADLNYTNEQLKIANEELQAANEELTTANENLDAAVQARTAELTKSVGDLHREAASRAKSENGLRTANQSLHNQARLLRSLAAQLTLAEHRERQRLARVLHDNLQQLLVSSRYGLELLARTSVGTARKSVDTNIGRIDEAIRLSRSLTAELCPPILQESGFVPALEWLVRWMLEKHGLSVRLTVKKPVAIAPEATTILLFQAVRELLFNVVKHANVKSARLQMNQQAAQLRVIVSDKGQGFDPSSLAQRDVSDGFGLLSIRERLSLIGGTMNIISEPGQGACVCLTVPTDNLLPAAAPSAEVPIDIPSAKPRHKARAPTTGCKERIRVLLADDHVIIRQGLAQLLRQEEDIDVVGQAGDGEAAVRLACELRPDVVVMDVRMPGVNGIDATRRLHRQFPDLRIIALSMYEEADCAAAMREAGASDYLIKSGPSQALIDAVHTHGFRRAIPPAGPKTSC